MSRKHKRTYDKMLRDEVIHVYDDETQTLYLMFRGSKQSKVKDTVIKFTVDDLRKYFAK